MSECFASTLSKGWKFHLNSSSMLEKWTSVLVFLCCVWNGSTTIDMFKGVEALRNLFSPTVSPTKRPNRSHGRYSDSEHQQSTFHYTSTASSKRNPDYFYPYSLSGSTSNNEWKPIYQSFSPSSDESIRYASDVDIFPNSHTELIQKATQPAILPIHYQNSGWKHPNYVDSTKGYALLHYYIPFDHVSAFNSEKPIEEYLTDAPARPFSINEIMKASVTPVAVFHHPTTSRPFLISTPAPSLLNDDDGITHIREPDESGKYEYEYIVQDKHHGTNFGHKEYRDGKYTKGAYEVVLPDGRIQHVQYWSDATGYHATVTYRRIF